MAEGREWFFLNPHLVNPSVFPVVFRLQFFLYLAENKTYSKLKTTVA
jgi:hypothetical protein